MKEVGENFMNFMRSKGQVILAIFYFTILALIILGPLLAPGYVFLLDFVFAPELYFNFSDYLSGQGLLSALPFSFIIYLLSSIIPTAIIQKIIFFFIFFFSGWSMWRVLPAKLGAWPRLIAGTFFVVNPFVYERFTVGHIGVFLGYALLPLVIQAIFRAFEKKTWRQVAWAVFLWTLQIIFSAHFLVITGVCVGVIFLVYVIDSLILRNRVYCHPERSEPKANEVEESLSKDKTYAWKGIPPLASLGRDDIFTFLKIIFLLLIFNSFWLIPTFLLHKNPTQEFNNAHFTAYQSSPDNHYGLLTNLIGMYGFWRERTSGGEFILAKDNLPVWPLFFVIFLIPIFFAIHYLWKEKKYTYAASLIVMAIVGVILSVGPQNGFLGSINSFIFYYIPAWRGLRESQKFISVLVFVYSMFIAYGVHYLRLMSKKRIVYYLVSIIIFLNIFVFNYPLLWAANNQLEARPYPVSYQKAEQIFNHDDDDYRILILPWHMYVIGHSLTPRRTIVDPAPVYFYTRRSKLLFSRNEEVGYAKNITPAQAAIGAWQKSSVKAEDWRSLLQDLGVKYIFVAKVTDVKKNGFDYSIFLNNKDFSVLVQDDYVLLFKVN